MGTIEGVLSDRIIVDGNDATSKIIKMVRKSRFGDQIKLIAINGIALAGLNVVDVKTVERRTGIPVIVLTRKKPDFEALEKALRNSGADRDSINSKIAVVKALNSERPFKKAAGFYLQADEKIDNDSIAETAFELLRLAHMIANGVSTGVSKGRI